LLPVVSATGYLPALKVVQHRDEVMMLRSSPGLPLFSSDGANSLLPSAARRFGTIGRFRLKYVRMVPRIWREELVRILLRVPTIYHT